MANQFPGFGRRPFPMMEMPKLGGDGKSAGPALGSITYASAAPSPDYVRCNGIIIPAPTKAGWPYAATAATVATNNLGGLANAIANTYVYEMAYGLGTYVAATDAGLYVSSDLVSWTKVPNWGPGSQSIGFINGYFYAFYNNQLCRTNNLSGAWSVVFTTTGSNQNINRFATDGANRICAMSQNYSLVLQSTDGGATWTQVIYYADNSWYTWYDVAWWPKGNAFILVGYYSSGGFMGAMCLSYDANNTPAFTYGVSWPGAGSITPTNVTVAGGEIRIYYSGGNQMYFRPDDGPASGFQNGWTNRNGTNRGVYSIKHDGTRYIAQTSIDSGGSSPRVWAYSADGLNFTNVTPPFNDSANRINFVNKRIIYTFPASKMAEMVLSSFTFTLPNVPTVIGANSQSLNPYMKVN